MKIFISYSYIGKLDGMFYQGFGNTIEDDRGYDDFEEYVEDLNISCRNNCLKTLGFDTATTEVLYFNKEQS